MQRLLCLLAFTSLLAGCAYSPFEREGESESPSGDYRAEGKASYYGSRHQGKRTASGERFNQNDLTAAHRTLPFGTRVRVTNLRNDRTVVVRINDRGPYSRTRIIDLSRKAAETLGMLRSGVAPVRVESLD